MNAWIKVINKASSISWIKEICMGSSSCTDHGSLSKRLHLGNEPFFILDILLLLRVRVIARLGSMSVGRNPESSSLLYNTQHSVVQLPWA